MEEKDSTIKDKKKKTNKKADSKQNNIAMTEKELNKQMDLYDIKQEILKVIIGKVIGNKIPKEHNKKILKYIEKKTEINSNTSPNNLDNRIASLYNTIKKQVDDCLLFFDITN